MSKSIYSVQVRQILEQSLNFAVEINDSKSIETIAKYALDKLIEIQIFRLNLNKLLRND